MSKADLVTYGITALDLLGSQEQIEKFFSNLMERIDPKHRLSAKLLEFRIFPKVNGLKIWIYPKKLKPALSRPSKPVSLVSSAIVVSDHFENIIRIAKSLKNHALASNLYVYQSSYYLELKSDARASRATVNNWVAIAYEYAQASRLTPEHLLKYGRLVRNGDALETLRYYFK